MSIIYSCKNTLSLPKKCYMKKPYTRNIPLLIVGAKYAAFQLIFGLDIPFFGGRVHLKVMIIKDRTEKKNTYKKISNHILWPHLISFPLYHIYTNEVIF